MQLRVWIAAGAALVAGSGAAAWWWTRGGPAGFVTEPVTRGSVSHAIVTTGSVNPVVTVQVGTYVSGPIQSISCDFNTQVEAGQLCAKIDPRPYQEALDQAKASLDTAVAQLSKDGGSVETAMVN